MANIRIIDNRTDFDSFIKKEGLNIVKFSAGWCGPCRLLTVNITNLDYNKIGNTDFAEIDVDSDFGEEISAENNIRGIPVLFFYKNGEKVDSNIGLMTTEALYQKISELC